MASLRDQASSPEGRQLIEAIPRGERIRLWRRMHLAQQNWDAVNEQLQHFKVLQDGPEGDAAMRAQDHRGPLAAGGAALVRQNAVAALEVRSGSEEKVFFFMPLAYICLLTHSRRR